MRLENGDDCFRLVRLGEHIEDGRLVRRERLREVLLELLWNFEGRRKENRK